ncbi:MAG: GAF domain-containing protein [Coleofasciculus sp. G3-WIS-01]|uniref:GAF domain-containing protein n=1 Tax=Coleofasciculus sp. G3-WIS-01 TaxID=3069528 RepID=UPI0032FAF21C
MIATRKQSRGSKELVNDAQINSIKRWQNQTMALFELTQSERLNAGDLTTVIRDLTKAAADALDVERVSVWLYNDAGSQLNCVERYYEGKHDHGWDETTGQSQGEDISPPVLPEKCCCLTNPLSLGRLDVPIWQNEQIIGILSYEQRVSSLREWTPQDKTFASAIANLIALRLDQWHHQQAMQELNSGESRYRILVETSADLISQHRTDGVYLYASPASRTLLGYEPDELVGHVIYEFVHPQDVTTIKPIFSNPIDCQQQQPIRYRILHQSGDYRWLESTINPIRHPQTNQVTELVVVSREMSQPQPTAESRPKATPDTLKMNPLAVAKQANPFKPLGLRSRLSRLTHPPAMPTTPAPPSHSRISALAAVVEDRLMSGMMLLGNQSLNSESRRTFSWVANAIAVAIDQYWARSELLSRRESLLFGLANQIRNSLELHTILETAVESIRTLLKIDRCQFLWYRLKAQTPHWDVVKEARTPHLPSSIGQHSTEQIAPLAQRIIKREVVQVDDVETCDDLILKQFLTQQGYTSILSLPIKTRAGDIGAISCIHGTEQRPWDNSEVELLQAVVAQLTIALDQASLYTQARESAEIAQAQTQELEQTLNQLQATQAKLVQSEKMSSLGQLVAGVAHELNNPVNFIHNNLTYASAYFYDLLSLVRLYQDNYPNPAALIAEQAELIDVDFIAEDLPKLLRSMQRGTDRISSIVLSLRNFSRLDEAEMKHADLNQGIESTLLILQHRLKPKGNQPEIKVLTEYGELPQVECYPGQLNQVFLNILNNAIDVLEQSFKDNPDNPAPIIAIRTRLLERSTDSSHQPASQPDTQTEDGKQSLPNCPRIVIQIADNGPGMTDEVKARLFDPFFSTKAVGQGVGLGLTICYQIVVEHHHGVLHCTSTPGKGTEFWIEIPIQQIIPNPG